MQIDPHSSIALDPEVTPEVTRAKQRFGIVGNAPALTAAVSRAVRVAPIDLSVLITGESGTGKEFFPQIIHAYSSRKHAKYIAVNCGAIPEGTIDSELFGHEKGSFTGAVASRKGYFEEADGGTIFLDEVAELPMTTQARLLRVLETGEFLKVGSSQVQKTNIRIVAATNVDLQRAIADGKFREDLFYRLSTVQITVPPLRDRGNDILLLTRKFANDFAERYRTPEIAFGEEARSELLRYRWPGNVRQLKNVVEQVSLFEAGTTVSAETLEQYLPSGAASYTPARTTGGSGDHTYNSEREMLFNLIFTMRERIDELTTRLDSLQAEAETQHAVAVEIDTPRPSNTEEPRSTSNVPVLSTLHKISVPGTGQPSGSADNAERKAIAEALLRNDGRRKAAAAELNISERTLYRKIREYGLE